MANTNTAKAPKYSPELVANLISDYDGGKGLTAKEIAEKYNLAVRSVIGKLVSEKVYVKAEVVPKTFTDNGPTKKETMKRFEALGLSEDVRKGLENATKNSLQVIAEMLENARASESTDAAPVAEVA